MNDLHVNKPSNDRAVVYVQLLTGLAFIGRLTPGWETPSESLALTDAMQIINVPLPVQRGSQTAITLHPMMIPVNHLLQGAANQALPYDMILTMGEPPDNHPLVAMYVKQVSGIQLVR